MSVDKSNSDIAKESETNKYIWRPTFEDNDTVTRLIKRSWPRNKSFLDYACFFIACILGITLGLWMVRSTWVIMSSKGAFVQGCPSPNGRLCNGKGTCESGVCVCYNVLYSGQGCADNLIPGYIPETGEECNGNGVAISAIKVPNVCDSSIILDNAGNRGGWLNPECGEYVREVQNQINSANGDPTKVPLSFTIPRCLCNVDGYSGVSCTANSCPLNNEGIICSGNGNTSVSFASNFTTSGNGCMCLRPFSFRFEEYQSFFTPAYLRLLFFRQNDAYEQVYCGQVSRVRDNDGNFIPDVILAYSTPDDYQCVCNEFWKGRICNEGRCPFGAQDGQICSGKGDPTKGQGLVLNTTFSRLNNVDCDLICEDGYVSCNRKCVYDQDGGLALFNEGALCSAPYQCPKRAPLRCYDGSCAPIPEIRSGKCFSNFRYGTFDFSRLDVAIDLFKCPNLTSLETVTECFKNTTYQPLITGYSDAGGVYFPTNQTLTINLTSPLVYIELVSNTSNLRIVNWDGQTVTFAEPGYISRYFQFTTSGFWSEPIVYTLEVDLVEDLTYNLFPMPWNYSSSVAFNESFTSIRVTQANQVFSFAASLSNVVLVTFSLTSPYNGVLVRANADQDAEPLFFYPDGTIVTLPECLSLPANCSWYKTSTNTQLRNMDSTKFLCVASGEPIVQNTACGTLFSAFYVGILSSLQNWYTVLQVVSDITIPVSVKEFDSYQLNTTSRTTWPFSLFWLPANESQNVALHDIVFLQQDQLTIPCACSQNINIPNQTVFDLEWWGEETLREVKGDTVSTGDYVLTAIYTSGERRFVRAEVVAIDTLSETLTVHEVNDDTLFDVYFVNARRLAEAEVLEGSEDEDLHFFPFHCPDGSATAAESTIRELSGTCNCTGQLPVQNCSCIDVGLARWGCEVNLTIPAVWCGLPANKEFEDYLLGRLLGLTTDECSGLIYTPTTSDLTNTSFALSIDALSKNMSYGLNQVLTNLYITVADGAGCAFVDFNITASSFLFNWLALPVNYTSYVSGCVHYLTLFVPQVYAVSTIRVVSNVTMVGATMIFSSNGFSITEMQEPTITASSNQDNAYLVNQGGGACWESDNFEIPVFVRYDFTQRFYVNYTVVEFCTAGIILDEEIIPAAIYMMGSNGDGMWYVLGSFGLFANTSTTMSLSLNNSESAYSSYMLYSRNGAFGVIRWQLYATSAFTCEDGTIMIANITDTTGLISVQDTIDEIAFFNNNVDPNVTCTGVDTCVLMNTDLSDNGVCEDVIYTAFLLGVPRETINLENSTIDLSTENTLVIIDNTPVNVTYSFFEFFENVVNGYDVIQFAETELDLFTESELEDLYASYAVVGPQVDDTSTTSVYYLYGGTNIVVEYFGITQPFNLTWVVDTFNLTGQDLVFSYEDLVTNGYACEAGTDATDCGTSNRNIPVMPGYFCELTFSQSQIQFAIANQTTAFNRTYYTANLTRAISPWTTVFTDIPIVRRATFIELQNCPEQVCTAELPYKCRNGACALSKADCDLRYNCPGNGCVEQTDVGFIGTYRCACSAGSGGSACQFEEAQEGTPFAPPNRRTPAGMEFTSGGPPPLRLKPPILDTLLAGLTTTKVEQLNMQTRGSCAPRSPQDIGYHCVLPTHATWGAVLMVKHCIDNPLLSPSQRCFESDCPGARLGYYGEYILLPEDVESENIQTGAKVWKTYTNPTTGENETFPWTGIFTYNNFPYRCPGCSQCVPDATYCDQACTQFPPCGRNGVPLVDGTCRCSPGFRTFMITEEFSQSIRYPYAVVNGVPDQTVWEINYNWKYHGLNQCTARLCQFDTCKAPLACYPGSPELNFADRLIACPPNTNRGNRCAPTINDCIAGTNLQMQLVCGGKGIARQKDYTGEEYCFCGDPISKSLSLSQVSQITQLQKNGYGGPNCDQFFADTTQPKVYSKINPETGEQYRSSVTRETLPGMLLMGNVIIGLNPDNKEQNDQCCSTFERLEYCDTLPCRFQGQIVCQDPGECLSRGGEPLVDVCNGHGTATADGECQCEVGDGFGYEPDYDQFSYAGCYKFFRCPVSEISGRPCNIVEQCGQPEEMRYPGISAKFFEQQWATCNPRVGPLTNVTRDTLVARSKDLSTQNVISALSNIAREVELANQRLTGCIDIWPDDTDTERCCMIVNGVSYTHNQSFSIPYMIPGYVVGYPILTDGTVQAFPLNETSVLFPTGSIIQFKFTDVQPYSAAAVRLYGVGNATLTFTSGLDVICPVQDIGTTGEYLTWNPGGAATSAIDCSSLYTCKLAKEFTNYAQNCAVNPISENCIVFKEQACLALPDTVYWPPDSLDRFQGCEREADPEGCVCCTRLVDVPQIGPTGLNITVTSGSIRLGQVRVYGFGDRIQTVPTQFREFLDAESTPSGCQDEAFMNDYAGGIHEFFAPDQQLETRENAQASCEGNGGYLATTDDPSDPSNVKNIVKRCQTIGADARCWVDALDVRSNASVVNISTIIKPQCATYGCYGPGGSVFGSTPFSVNATSPINYDNEQIGDQMITSLGIERIFRGNIAALDGTIPASVPSACLLRITTTGKNTAFDRSYRCGTRDVVVTFAKGDNPLGAQNNAFVYMGVPYGIQELIMLTLINAGISFDFLKHGRCIFREIVIVTDSTGNTQCPLTISRYTTSKCTGRSVTDSLATSFGAMQLITTGIQFRGYVEQNDVGTSTQAVWTIGDAKNNPYCLVFYPPGNDVGGVITLLKIEDFTARRTIGTIGYDRVYGYDTLRFMPGFLKITLDGYLRPFGGRVSTGRGTIIRDNDEPIYFQTNSFKIGEPVLNAIIDFPNILSCSACQVSSSQVDPEWDRKYYLDQAWPVNIDTQVPMSVFISLKVQDQVEGIANPQRFRPLFEYATFNFAAMIFTHQTVYIQTKALMPDPPYVNWDLPSCLVVGPSGLEASTCQNTTHNYVCNRDWPKYAVPSGLMGDQCGANIRISGFPTPLKSCFEEVPLANATLFPTEHEIYAFYQIDALDEYIRVYNLQPSDASLTYDPVIWGVAGAYIAWINGVSSRAAFLSTNQVAVENWCSMSIEILYPVTCKRVYDPQTNLPVRRCAVSLDYCDPSIVIPEPTTMNNISRPPIFEPVSETNSFSDPTCGSTVFLARYAFADQEGGAQTNLFTETSVLALDPAFVIFQSLGTSASWYNAGKTTTNFKAQIDVTVSISGRYFLSPCLACTTPVLRVMLYPINEAYELDESEILFEDVSMVVGTETTFLVSFTVTLADTGSVTIGTFTLPELVYEGVGFRVTGITEGAGVKIFNPVITDNVTRAECTTRTPPQWYNPPLAVESPNPDRVCVSTVRDKLFFIGLQNGQCACDLSSAGSACDFPAITGPNGKLVCAGFGDEGKAVMGIDGNIYVTGTGENAGGYVIPGVGSDCKTIDLARVAYTTLVDGSVWSKPYVAVSALPVAGQSIYVVLDDTSAVFENYTDIDAFCTAAGMYIPWYTFSDELEQMISVNVNDLPIFLGVDISLSTADAWPWLETDAYFIRNNTGVVSSAEGTCIPDDTCPIVNVGNFAYLAEVDNVANDCLVDGDTLTACTPVAGTLTWTGDSGVSILVYVFGSTTGAGVGCATSGFCNPVEQAGPNSYYLCNCPSRRIEVGGGTYTEIQVFNQDNLMRTTSYRYYM